MEKNKLSLIFQKALLFNISSNTRFVCANVSRKKLEMFVGLDREPTEDEKDMFFSVSAEVTGHFAELDERESEVKFLVDITSPDDLANTNTFFYARCDYLDKNGNLL